MTEALYSTPTFAPPEQFEQWWQQHGEWVEEPNQRRGGESGVQRVHGADGKLLYAKRQVGHLYRSLRHPFGRPTVLRERDALEGFRRLGVQVPEVMYCGALRSADKSWRGLLVTAALDGFQEVDNWYANGGREHYGEQLHQKLLQALGAMLARLHLGHWQHSCLYAKHIFVRVTGEGATAQVDVALLDLEKARRRLSKQRAARHDLRQLRRHSSWNSADWQQLIYGYQTAFGSAIKGLQS
ncbi:InaA protein [Pseudomonas cavernicola]|uniref:InaA protein n=1 Tax=Pseudomonas cavernicola TaxID=2320866 RepID=A0A418XH70_9PSED|nr:lipopolysaccharide kinase InaA family protein [Pseudomonas cavernicola]RJG11819.1 InaA protein [Pseudomonas cavernicola]